MEKRNGTEPSWGLATADASADPGAEGPAEVFLAPAEVASCAA